MEGRRHLARRRESCGPRLCSACRGPTPMRPCGTPSTRRRWARMRSFLPLFRIRELRELSSAQLKIFTGGHGRTRIDEMNRGFSGTMSAASLADLDAHQRDQRLRRRVFEIHFAASWCVPNHPNPREAKQRSVGLCSHPPSTFPRLPRGVPVPRRLSKNSLKIRQQRLYLVTPSVYNSASSYDDGANGGSK